MSSGSASRLIGQVRARAAGHRAQIFFGVAILWVVVVFLLITFQPAPGAQSPAALEAAVRSRVAAQDARGLGRLFAAGTVGDDYPAAVLTRLTGAGPWNSELRDDGDGRELVLVGPSGCLGWLLTREDDRWFLDGVPPLVTPCPR